MSYQDSKKGNRKLGGRRLWRSLGGLFTLNVALSLLVSGLFVGYLVLNNQATASGFTVRGLEKQIAELRDEGDTLSLQVVAMQAMDNVERQVGELGFVPVTNLEYISSAPSMVAVK